MAKEFQLADVSSHKQDELDQLAGVFSAYKDNNYLSAFKHEPMDELLETARSANRVGHWELAALLLDIYFEFVPDDHQGHFQRGVAYANKEGGSRSDAIAASSYGSAILFLPDDADPNLRARYFSYRAAMLKRLGLLDAARNDLVWAGKLASNIQEANDITYNLCCVYALQGKKKELLKTLNNWTPGKPEFARINKNIEKYFHRYKADSQFVSALKKLEKRLP